MSVLTVTKENFQQEVMESGVPVLIDFFAVWCGPCNMLSPVIDQLAGEVKGVKVCKINVDEQPELAAAFQVASIPTLVLVKNGTILQKVVGVRPKDEVKKMMEDAL